VGRWLIGERHLRRALLDELSRQQGKRFPLPAASLEVGDAADAGYWARHREAEYIFSEDVFEHIPAEALPRLVAMIAGSMHPKGIAVIKPMIYTGICGGHHLEWFPHTHNQPTQRRTGPWEHLRQNRYPADTYLNRLTRADYRKLIAQNFDILEETVAVPGMGSQFMTPEIRDELRAYSDEELYSNSVRFVLRPRS